MRHSRMLRHWSCRLGILIAAAFLAPGCRDVNVNAALAQLSQAQHLAG